MAERFLRVGLFQNYPIVFQDEHDVPKGIYVDILEKIAGEQGWAIRYVPDRWNNCLENLRTGKIDLMTNIAYTEKRDSYIDFSNESVLMMWGQVYVNENIKIQNIFDLEGLNVAVLKGGINAINFKKLIEKFQINCQLVVVDTQLKILDMTSKGETDAGVINNVFGAAHQEKYKIRLSPVLFNPFKLVFAVPEGADPHVLKTIDKYLTDWKKKDESFYHTVLKKWYGRVNTKEEKLPQWIFPLLGGIGLIIGLLFLWMTFLRRQVKLRTKELQISNEKLRSEIHERVLTSERLKESEEKYRVLFRSSSDAILLVDVETLNLIDANEKAVELYGYSYEEFLSQKATDLSAEADKTIQVLQHDFSDNIPLRYHKKKDGTVFPVEISANYFEFKGRRINLSDIRDITERMNQEEKRLALEERLQQAQKMESIGNLAGGIAHDFNNILSSIIGFTDLAIRAVEKGSQTEDDLLEVKKGGHRAKELVRQILTFARRSDEKIKPIQVTPIAKEVLQFIKSSIPSTIMIEEVLQSDSSINGSSTQVHQIFMNLCTNAAQAMEKKGGILRISVKDVFLDKSADQTELKSGRFIELMVSDTGQGIPEEQLPFIFEPYFTSKEQDKGTGLGLAVVHGIVVSYGGKITVKSKINEGTRFIIWLPISEQRQPCEKSGVGELPTGRERILFVDDEPSIAKMGSRMLRQLGYAVTEKYSSLEALGYFRQNKNSFDLVISDMTMPGLTGDQLAEKILKTRPEIPIIVCTGYSKNINDIQARRIGIKKLLYKPFEHAKLAIAVREVLDPLRDSGV